ncbi:MAG TPA: alkaline phosphatase family protein [Streptosporangiaceae bacterium]|nr:alkaline phosphatase family protein [Streptosporangiaceae bacterium]
MRLAAGALGALGLLAATGYTSQAALASPGTPSTTASASHPCGTASKPGTIKHVIWIWLENHSYNAILGSSQAPYFNTLAKDCGLATNYHNVTHPSLPNYIAATSGLGYSSIQKFLPDCSPSSSCDTSAKSIFGQGESWKSYEESMPSTCDHSNSGNYAVRHNPAVYYTTLHGCSSDDVSYSHLASDLAHNQLPAFSFVTPNLIDDMHNGTVADGNRWMSRNLPTILNSAEYKNGSTVIFITFDEGSDVGSYADGEHCATNTSDTSCHLPTFVISPSTKVGARSGTLFNHYSLLATAEQLLHLSKLGQAASAATMTSAFNL